MDTQDKTCQVKPNDPIFLKHTQGLIREMREATDDFNLANACEVHFLGHIQDYQMIYLFGDEA